MKQSSAQRISFCGCFNDIYRGFMRIFILIAFITLLVYCFTTSQVLNPGFETWTTGSAGTNCPYYYPNNWHSWPDQSISKSSIAHSGLYSCCVAVIKDTCGLLSGDTSSPLLMGTFSLAQHYTTLTGYYQFISASNCTRPYGPSPVPCNDSIIVLIIGTTWQGAVAEGLLHLGSATSWTPFSVPLTYQPNAYPSGTKPDSITIEISISPNDLGSYFLIDDVNFEGNVSSTMKSIRQPQLSLARNYPNPFSYSTQIEYVIPACQSVSLNIFNSLGREVKTIINNEMKIAGDYKETIDLSHEPNGLYLYKLQMGNIVEMHAMSKTGFRQ